MISVGVSMAVSVRRFRGQVSPRVLAGMMSALTVDMSISLVSAPAVRIDEWSAVAGSLHFCNRAAAAGRTGQPFVGTIRSAESPHPARFPGLPWPPSWRRAGPGADGPAVLGHRPALRVRPAADRGQPGRPRQNRPSTDDIAHSLTIDEYRIAKRAAPGHPVTFEFRADRAGPFRYYCNLQIEDGCRQMHGELVVKPRPPGRGRRIRSLPPDHGGQEAGGPSSRRFRVLARRTAGAVCACSPSPGRGRWSCTSAMRFPGNPGDNYSFLWNLWWMRHVLATPGLPLFHTSHLFYPFGTTIADHPHCALPALRRGNAPEAALGHHRLQPTAAGVPVREYGRDVRAGVDDPRVRERRRARRRRFWPP